jgi:hypothetical protein
MTFLFKIALMVALLLCSGVIFLSELTKNTIIHYDCRLATYPTAIDVPQEVIKKCKE